MSADFFKLLGQPPILGRDFRPEDDQPSSSPTIIISAGVWKTRYGGDPNIIGKTIKGNGLVPTVIGVMPEGMKFPFNTDVWFPFAHLRYLGGTGTPRNHRLVIVTPDSCTSAFAGPSAHSRYGTPITRGCTAP